MGSFYGIAFEAVCVFSGTDTVTFVLLEHAYLCWMSCVCGCADAELRAEDTIPVLGNVECSVWYLSVMWATQAVRCV